MSRLAEMDLVLFEGWDASGKGGAIKCIAERLDPRHVRVRQFAGEADACAKGGGEADRTATSGSLSNRSPRTA